MARKIILIIISWVVCTQQIQAQSILKTINTNIVGYKFNTVTNVGTDDNPVWEKVDDRRLSVHISAGISLELPLISLHQNSSLGITLEAVGGFLASNEIDGVNLALVYDIPGYVVFRYGVNANRKTTKSWGFGFGAGYHVSRGALPYEAPSVMAQISFSSHGLIRISYDILPYIYYDFYSSEGLIPALKIRRLGIGFYSKF